MSKKLRYLNTNCLGNALTVNSSNSFNAKFTHNNYIQFYKDTDYIFFGHRDQLKDSIYFESNGIYSFDLSKITSGMLHIGQNLVYNQTADLWVSQASYDFANKKYIIVLSNNKQYETNSINVEAWTNKWGISLDNSGLPHLLNMGRELTLTQVSDSTNVYDEFTYINAIKLAGGNVQPSSGPSFLPIWNFGWRSNTGSDSEGDTHIFSASEGIGNPYLYDRKGNLIGRYYVASQSNSWKFDGFKTAYNTLNGFTCDADFLQYSERIPLNKELCIYKSDFTKNLDSWIKETGMEGVISIDTSRNVLEITNNTYTFSDSASEWKVNSIVIQNAYMNISPKQFGRGFRVKFKLTNRCPVNITRGSITLGAWGSINGLGGKNFTISPALGENETIEISQELERRESLIWNATTLKITFGYESVNTEANPFKCEVSDISLFQIDHLQENPVTTNGKNNSESNIDFTCNVSNSATQNYIPELRMLPAIPGQNAIYYIPPYTNPDPSMGATTDGGWNITSKPSSNVTKGNWIAPTNYITYLKNHETTDDLPEGVTSAIDMKTSRIIGFSGSSNFFHDNNWVDENPFVGRFINKFRIKYSLWYRVNPNRTITTPNSYQFSLGVFYTRIEYITSFQDTEWHKLEGETILDLTQCNTARVLTSSRGTNDHMVGLSWMTTDTSVEYAGTIADFQYTLEMVEDTFSPVICKLDPETKSLSNILVYNNHQRDINLLRAKNHLTHF